MNQSSGIPDYIRDELRPPAPTSAAPGVGDQITASLADAPWWAWPLTLLAGVAVLAAVGWLLSRAARRGVAAIRAAAAGGMEQREQVAAFIRAQAMTVLFGAIVAIVVGLSAQTMVGWLRSIGMATHWAVLGFVAFDGMATMLALTLWQRSRRGESTGMIRPTLWALVGSAAWLNSHHAPEGNVAAGFAYAAFPVIAAVGLEFLLQEQRRDRDWLKEQAGEKSRRRLALVRWLHPVERVQVALEMARDEDMGADEATRIVRERNAAAARARAIRRVRTAVWTLRRDQAAPRSKWFGWAVDRRERVSEARAQAAIAAAQMATDTATVAVVLRELQMMTLAGTFAGLDYSSADAARRAVGHLITEEALRPLELGTGPASPEGPDDFPPDGWGQMPELDDDLDDSEPEEPWTDVSSEAFASVEAWEPIPAPAPVRKPATVTALKSRPRVTDTELLARARKVWEPGMSVTAFRSALGVGMKKAHPLHQQLRAESKAS